MKNERNYCDKCGQRYFGEGHPSPHNDTEEPLFFCTKCHYEGESPLKDKYVIIDLRNMDFMKDEDGKIEYYDTQHDAGLVCGMYEFEDAWIMKLIYNHKEEL